MMERPTTNACARLLLARRKARAASERMPPSPRLSARMISRTYLMVTTMTSDQNISESTPSTALSVPVRPAVAAIDSRNA